MNWLQCKETLSRFADPKSDTKTQPYHLKFIQVASSVQLRTHTVLDSDGSKLYRLTGLQSGVALPGTQTSVHEAI